jgi:hypothetical protein
MPTTKADFEKFKANYEAEKARYEALKVGQIIYITTGFDNFAHEVVSVDVDARIVECLDHSLKGKPATLEHGGWYETQPPCM